MWVSKPPSALWPLPCAIDGAACSWARICATNRKNILMIGPTGVGKTESRDDWLDWLTPPLSKLKPPSSPKSAMSGATWSRLSETCRCCCQDDSRIRDAESRPWLGLAEERILDVLLPQARSDETPTENDSQSAARQYSEKIRQGELDDKEIEIKVAGYHGVENAAPPGLED